MRITYNAEKRADTLRERGLDFADAASIFEGRHATKVDDREDKNYGETRFITAGKLHGRLVVMVWTPRGNARRVISMRHCHEYEAAEWEAALGGPG